MINKSISLILLVLLATSPAAFAAGDPMKSLFLFQQKMAEKGNASAMMKMGEMYERGEGVEKSNENALKMYEQANAKGHKKAKAAVQRLKNAQNKSGNKNRLAEQKKLKQQQAIAAEKKRKEREAAAKQAKAKADKEAKAAAKAKADKNANTKAAAAKAKADKDAKARAKAAAKAKADKNAKARAKAAAKAKADKDAKARAKAAAKAKAANEARAKAKAARIAAEKKRQASKNPKEGFKSDPCKGKAARFSSICK